jgi:hypothetical protein
MSRYIPVTKNVAVPRREKPYERATYRDIPPAGLHIHWIKKGYFIS